MHPPAIARLGHVALETPDLSGSVEFFRDIVGLEEVERADETIYLRGVEEFEHHTLALRAADAAGVDHLGWQTSEPGGVDAVRDLARTEGLEWTDVDGEAGQGPGVQVWVPSGHVFEFFFEVESPEPPAARRSRLRNRVYSPASTRGPRRLDHVQIWDPAARTSADWLQSHLDFDLHEYFDLDDGTRWGSFLSAGGVKVDVAVVHDSDGQPPSLHHLAYKVESVERLFDAADVMSEHGITADAGPGMHAMTRAKFLYAKDPASDHRIELSTGGFHVFAPTWDPIEWTEADVGGESDHQWIGIGATDSRVPY